MSDKKLSVTVCCETDGETLSVPLSATPSTARAVAALKKSDSRLVCKRIAGHQRRVSVVNAQDQPINSSETGDFAGSLPRTTQHALAMWSVMWGGYNDG